MNLVIFKIILQAVSTQKIRIMYSVFCWRRVLL